jgi:signal transduction histidine kinase
LGTSGTVGTVLAQTQAALSRPAWLRVSVAEDLPASALPGLDEAFVQALCSVLRNAEEASTHEASPEGSSPEPKAVIAAAAVLLEVQRSPANRSLATAGLVFMVKDRGHGMDAAVLSRVGEPFFTTKSPGRGMGLGLFLARAVVERLGGSLTLESEVGRGTTVTLEVPCHTRPEGESS